MKKSTGAKRRRVVYKRAKPTRRTSGPFIPEDASKELAVILRKAYKKGKKAARALTR